MLARKVSKYSWRACQPYEACYNYNRLTVKKQFSFWKVAISIIAAFFVVIFVAQVLNNVSHRAEVTADQKTAIRRETKVSWVNKVLGIKTAQAATFSAQKMQSSCDQITLTAGEVKDCTFGFLNIGSASWSNSSSSFASIYTAKPNYTQSPVKHNSWYLPIQPAKMSNPLVGPGQLALFSFKIEAPKEAGTIYPAFRLALEDTAWVSGGEFTLTIKVVASQSCSTCQGLVAETNNSNETTVKATEEEPESETTVKTIHNSAAISGTETNGAQKLIQSATSLEFKDKNKQLVRVGFKNTGLTQWRSYGNDPVALVPRDITTQSISDASWLTENQIVFMKTQEVANGEIGYFEFYLSPNGAAGDYLANFQLKTGNRIIPGSECSLPITVYPGAAITSKANPAAGRESVVIAQAPTVRVGLTRVKMPVWLAADAQYEIWANKDRLIAAIPANEPVTVDYANGQYTITTNQNVFTVNEIVRLVPQNGGNGIWTIKNYESRLSWNRSLNDNQFRGIMEINYSPSTDRAWLINELGMEYYLRGLGESSNISPIEYQKALVTAARTYAYYYVLRTGRFSVYDTSASQVYNGYGAEKRTPKVTEAVIATRGEIVTYNNELAVTPYFSQSDGRTRSYAEVWGSTNMPWLISVAVPQDINNSLWGHGVGMSCRAAINMANEGQTYDQILRYFYTGTSLRKDW